MTKLVTGLLAFSMLAAFAVGGAMSADRLATRHRLAVNSAISHVTWTMPEVVSTAEKPRLVMPTVEVRAGRIVAMSGTDLRAF